MIVALTVTPEFVRFANDQRFSNTPMNVMTGNVLGRYSQSDDVDIAVIFRNPTDGKTFVDQFKVSLARLIAVGALSGSEIIDTYKPSVNETPLVAASPSDDADYALRKFRAASWPIVSTTKVAVGDLYVTGSGNAWVSIDGNSWTVIDGGVNKQPECVVSPQEQALSEKRPIRAIEV